MDLKKGEATSAELKQGRLQMEEAQNRWKIAEGGWKKGRIKALEDEPVEGRVAGVYDLYPKEKMVRKFQPFTL